MKCNPESLNFRDCISYMDDLFNCVDDVRNCKADDDKGCKDDDGVSEENDGCSAQYQQVSMREPDVGGVVAYVCKARVQPLGALNAQECYNHWNDVEWVNER